MSDLLCLPTWINQKYKSRSKRIHQRFVTFYSIRWFLYHFFIIYFTNLNQNYLIHVHTFVPRHLFYFDQLNSIGNGYKYFDSDEGVYPFSKKFPKHSKIILDSFSDQWIIVGNGYKYFDSDKGVYPFFKSFQNLPKHKFIFSFWFQNIFVPEKNNYWPIKLICIQPLFWFSK